jgi:hypothetical protein
LGGIAAFSFRKELVEELEEDLDRAGFVLGGQFPGARNEVNAWKQERPTNIPGFSPTLAKYSRSLISMSLVMSPFSRLIGPIRLRTRSRRWRAGAPGETTARLFRSAGPLSGPLPKLTRKFPNNKS